MSTWTPVLPGQTVKTKKLVLYELLYSDYSKELFTGADGDCDITASTKTEKWVVAYREFRE